MNKIIITFGLIYGIYSIISSYLMLNQMVGVFALSGISFLVAFVLFFLCIRNYKSKNDGFASFKEIFLLCIGVAIVGFTISSLGSQAYMQTMSEETKEEISTNFVDSQVSMYENMGIDTLELEEELAEQANEMFSVKNTIIGTISGILMMAVIAVIFALIFRKDPPITAV